MTIDPILEMYRKYKHLDRRIELLRRDKGYFVNEILKDFWEVIKLHVEENHPEVIP